MFTLPPLDDLRREIKPTNLGHEAGEAGVPPPDAQDDPHEQPIAEKIRALRDEARARLDGHLDQARKHLTGNDTDARGDINAAVREAESRFDEAAEVRRPKLEDLRRDENHRRNDLAQFRRANDLDRSADYPEFGWVVAGWGFVAFLFLVESFANSVFLGRGNEAGIIGAYTIAIGISIANLVPALLFFGPAVRYLAHVRPAPRVLAGLALSVFVLFVLTLNLGVAHYREVSGQLLGEGGFEVVRRVTQTPLGLEEAQSWLLFFIGLIFSCIALFDGWKLDDAYPGYGNRDRLLRQARQRYLDERGEVVDELDGIRQETLDDLKRIASNARKQPEEQRRIVLNWHQICDDYERHVSALEDIGATLVEEYREANHAARADKGIPRAHRSRWRMAAAQPADKRALGGLDTDFGRRIEAIEQADHEATDRVHTRCEATRESLLADENAPSRGGGADDGRAATRA